MDVGLIHIHTVYLIMSTVCLNSYEYSILCYNEVSGHDLNSAPEAPIAFPTCWPLCLVS